mgnify:CR=1 FL=1
MLNGNLKNLSREREVHMAYYTQLTQEERYHISVLCKERFITMTVDNGREFAGHKEIASRLNVDVFFAHPYHSWERGLNENTNGLLRQYFPKKTDLRKISIEHVLRVQHMLNNRPRKLLNFLTPDEVFNHRSYKTNCCTY